MTLPKITERSFYPIIIEVIESFGGSGVQEVSFNSEPDILFDLRGQRWLLSVKIGETVKIIKNALLQYLRHKEESGLRYGLVLLLPESIRRTHPTASDLRKAIEMTQATTLVDAGPVKEEFRKLSVPQAFELLVSEIIRRLSERKHTYYPLPLVISLLQQQVTEMMEEISLGEKEILDIVTNPDLLKGIGHLEKEETDAVAHFLASYIILSQILFLRLFITAHHDFISGSLSPITHQKLRSAFAKILDINYRPIFEVDVLDSISKTYLKDTFDLIWGLEIERARYELPGRIFHELMPRYIRKMLAAFYTRPQAADILAQLAIDRSSNTVFDIASGSGTILVSAYKRKKELYEQEGKAGNPHKRFCENEIFGADIMPFAVHLTSANLAAMDVRTTIDRTQVIIGDSLRLFPGKVVSGGMVSLEMFPDVPTARTSRGEAYKVFLDKVDNVLMNPPFTKVERGIRRFIDMSRFEKRCGGEIGLWGHFIALAEYFLKEDGIMGAVIPINVLRGRESGHIRKMLFEEWTPLYILKPTRNYGFSEWAEYRDVIFIARKHKPEANHRVKFCLIKKDLTRISESDVRFLTETIKKQAGTRSDEIDIDSHSLSEVQSWRPNLMWFCGASDLKHRDILVDFITKVARYLKQPPSEYFREGYRPVPKGVSDFLFLTRATHESRTAEAFLSFSNEGKKLITASSQLKVTYNIECENIKPTLRTSVGVLNMDITKSWDYIAYHPYNELKRVLRATKFKPPEKFSWDAFWDNIKRELDEVKTHLVVSHRINPYSPNTHLNAFFSKDPISPSNQLNVIKETNKDTARAICVILNSVIFFSQFFLLKEESTGRYINIRFYDLELMKFYPLEESVPELVRVFERYSKLPFPPIRKQFDEQFDERYEEYWERERGDQGRLFSVLDKEVIPSNIRINFDLDICKTLKIPINRKELIRIYDVLVREMILTRGLKKD